MRVRLEQLLLLLRIMSLEMSVHMVSDFSDVVAPGDGKIMSDDKNLHTHLRVIVEGIK